MMLGLMCFVTLISLNDRSGSASASKTTVMIAEWERAKAYTLEYLSAADEEVIVFKPTPEMRTFGQQMLHLAEANYGFASAASGKTSPIKFGQLEKAADDYRSKDALTKALMESYDFVIAALKETEESQMDDSVKIFDRFEMSRETGFHKAFEHQTHHRGQTTVYLRLKGIKPPNERLL